MNKEPYDDFLIEDNTEELVSITDEITKPDSGTCTTEETLPPPVPDQFRTVTPPPLPDGNAPLDVEEEIAAAEEAASQTNPESAPECSCIEIETKLAAQTEMISTLMSELNGLKALFEEKIAYDTHKNELFDKMYAELSSYKNDLYSKILKPFVLGTLTLLDDINKFLSTAPSNEEMTPEYALKALRFLKGVPDDLTDLLEANGVELYTDTDSKAFNPRTQRAVKQVATDNPDLDNTIANRMRNGYHWNGAILRPEMVEIFKFRKQ